MAAFKLHYLPEALADLDDLYDYIAEREPKRAESYIHELRQHLETHAAGPFNLSRPRAEWGADFRSFTFGKKPHMRTIAVEFDAGTMYVHRIFGRQDITAHLSTDHEDERDEDER